jgi:hypothetical protein
VTASRLRDPPSDLNQVHRVGFLSLKTSWQSSERASAVSVTSRKNRLNRPTYSSRLMSTAEWSGGVAFARRVLDCFPSSQLYLLVVPTWSVRLRLPVHDFIARSPVDPLRKINNLAAAQFTTLFHGYTRMRLRPTQAKEQPHAQNEDFQ